MSDVLLVMPPVSEAVQFPYLALPQLAAAWTAQGHRVRTLDLNLEYRARVLVRRHEPSAADDPPPGAALPSAGAIYRAVSERYRARHGVRLLETARDRSTGFAQEAAIQATVRYVTQQASQDGWIVDGPLLLSELDRYVEAGRESWSARWCADRIEELLSDDPPRMLAFSVPFFSQLVPVLTLCVLLRKRRPALRIALGGPTVQMWAAPLRRHVTASHAVDHWCLGHGEDFLTRVLGGGTRVPGTGGRGGTGEDTTGGGAQRERTGLADGFVLSEQPMPDFGPFDFSVYTNMAHQFPYRLTVGCYWGKCTFCSYGNRYRDARAFQQIDPEVAAGHLVALAGRLGMTDVAVTDENTGLRHLLRVTEAVRRRGAVLTFRVRARLERELADPAFCERLRAAGCVQVSTGFETAHQGILDSLHKGQDAAHAERAVLNLTRAGIVTNLSFMDGFEHDDALRGSRETVEVVRRHPADMGLDTMQLVVAEPGSYLWAGRRRQDDDYLVTNEGLAFAGGRVGGALLEHTATEEARQRLLRMTVEAVPDAERAARPDLPPRGQDRPAAVTAVTGPALRARPRFGVALDSVRTRWFLADVAWPRMAAVPVGVERVPGGGLTAEEPRARRWLAQMIDKRLLVPDPPETESA
ncbi:B12-binding domain-containing radical SAM protein [Streptomyces sp. NPDC014623]|uniref:B12-binding domain-containing radical SAM protein n=1 Tax=Streptomyces sp. NPDC014623 TaxID=3364875 RepID=UPI003702131E